MTGWKQLCVTAAVRPYKELNGRRQCKWKLGLYKTSYWDGKLGANTISRVCVWDCPDGQKGSMDGIRSQQKPEYQSLVGRIEKRCTFM